MKRYLTMAQINLAKAWYYHYKCCMLTRLMNISQRIKRDNRFSYILAKRFMAASKDFLRAIDKVTFYRNLYMPT